MKVMLRNQMFTIRVDLKLVRTLGADSFMWLDGA
jgi:hypothetical protein